MATTIGIAVLLLLLFFGLPVALALGVAGGVGLYAVGGSQAVIGVLSSTPLSAVSSYEFISIPMFILMANVIIASGISDDMFDVAKTWMGRVPGGLAHATAITGAAFGAISGSSTASAATLSSTSIPGMIKQGYEPQLAAGVVAISGTLAMLIPPSVAMVLYALLANLGVGKLLVAGIIPGLAVTATIMLTIAFLVWQDPSRAPPGSSYTIMQKIRSLKTAWSFIVLFLMVTGTIYAGIGTPTEASALGALAACLLAVARRTSFAAFVRALVVTAEASCMIALIIVGAQIFGYFLIMTQTTQSLVVSIAGSGVAPWVILIFVLFLYLVLGCFMDLVAMLILTVPILAPLMAKLGYDPIWFAVITVVMAEVGMITPPLGMNVFVISKYTRMPVSEVFRGSYPHVIAHMILVAVLVLFPGLVTWLPSTMR